jgi:putative hydrolase of the HAD superfamily
VTDQAAYFDLDGTLVHLDRPYEDVVLAALGEHLDAADPALADAYSEAFFAAFRAQEADPFGTGMAAVLEAVDGDAPDADPAAMTDSLREAEYRAATVPDGAAEALASLGEDVAVGVLTNGLRDWQVGKLERVGLAGHVDAVVASYEAGAHKPDPAPFELAEERLPAAEYAMVGDTDGDVEGARAAGWVPIRYDPGEGPSFWATLSAML